MNKKTEIPIIIRTLKMKDANNDNKNKSLYSYNPEEFCCLFFLIFVLK